MAMIKEERKPELAGCGETGPRALLRERKMETVWRFLRKLDTESPCDANIPLPAAYPQERKAGTRTGFCIALLTAALVTVAEKWKSPTWPPTGGRINEMW